LLQAWEQAGFSTDWCRQVGADIRGMRTAKDVRQQLERIIGADGGGLEGELLLLRACRFFGVRQQLGNYQGVRPRAGRRAAACSPMLLLRALRAVPVPLVCGSSWGGVLGVGGGRPEGGLLPPCCCWRRCWLVVWEGRLGLGCMLEREAIIGAAAAWKASCSGGVMLGVASSCWAVQEGLAGLQLLGCTALCAGWLGAVYDCALGGVGQVVMRENVD
jgi:hypothetical protein